MRSLFGRSYGTYVEGTIVKDGKEIRLRSVADAIDAGLAYVSEDRKTLGLNLLDDIKRTTVVGAAQAHHRAASSSTSARSTTIAESYRKSLRTKAPNVDEGVAKLSGGNQQKVVLAKWMFTDPTC